MADGVELVAGLLRSSPMSSVIEEIHGTRDVPERRRDLGEWLRTSAGTMFHPAGKCRMAPDDAPHGVVDAAGRVRGVEGLRVVDASVFPSLPRATIHHPVVAVSQKLAGEMRRTI